MNELSQKSLDILGTCHSDIQKVVKMAIGISAVDFSCNQGQRSFDLQLEYFLNGTSRIDPRIESQRLKAKHLRTPSWALDFKIYIPGHPEMKYNDLHLCYVAGIMMTCAKVLRDRGEINHEFRWGGNWDSDGIIKFDQTLWDACHIEII